MEKFYSTFEVAKICRVSPGSVTRWIKEGRLPASLTAGGHHRITGQDLQALLKELKLPMLPERPFKGNDMILKQKPASILVIDDEPSIHRLLEDELGRQGYRVTSVISGAEGLEKLRKSEFPVVICDVLMPEMNGIQFLEMAMKINPDLEVILMTGHGDIEMAVEAMKKGAYDFVQKPFNRAEFLHRIENALEKHRLKETVKDYEVNFDQTQEKLHMLENSKRALEQAQEELIRTEKLSSIGRFVTGVAHEINNPLTSIIGYSQLLMDYQIPENMARPLKIMHEQAKRCGKIVQDLMVFASRKNLDTAQWTTPGNLIQETIKDLDSEIRAKGIKVILNPEHQAPARVWAESFRIKQVFYDILKNAIQALEGLSGPKCITIEVGENDGHWRAMFKDNGPGIPKELHTKIFDPFFTTKEVGKGSGLGLSMAFGIVREHGGQISVQSELGKGAAFYVELPLKLPQSAGPENLPSASAA